MRVVRRVRDAIWSMKDPQDMGGLLGDIRTGLLELGIPLLYCGVNIVDTTTKPPNAGDLSEPARQAVPGAHRHQLGEHSATGRRSEADDGQSKRC